MSKQLSKAPLGSSSRKDATRNLNTTRGSKLAVLPRSSSYKREFLSDWQRLSKSGRYDMKSLKEVMMLLIMNNDPLGPEWKDHSLINNWRDHRELHVGGDFLLVYKIENYSKYTEVVFVRTGTHSEIF